MATPLELIAQGNTLIDDQMDNSNWINWFNDAIDDLSEVLFIETKTTVDAPDIEGWFDLPANFKTEMLVQTDDTHQYAPIDLSDAFNSGYKIFNGKIKLINYSGTAPTSFTLYYYKVPTYMTTAAATLEVDMPSIYLEAIVLYGCMRALQSDDEAERYGQFKTDYINSKNTILRTITKKKSRRIGSWRVVR